MQREKYRARGYRVFSDVLGAINKCWGANKKLKKGKRYKPT